MIPILTVMGFLFSVRLKNYVSYYCIITTYVISFSTITSRRQLMFLLLLIPNSTHLVPN